MTEDLTAAIKRIFADTNDVILTAEKLDIDPGIVRHHLTKEGIKLPKGSYRFRSGPKNAAISQFHAAIGAKIAYLRIRQNKINISDFAYDCGLSTKKFGFIERGTTDATVSDLMRIGKALGVSPWELTVPLAIDNQGEKS